MFEELKARQLNTKPDDVLKVVFKDVIKQEFKVDAIFTDTSYKKVIGIANIINPAPIMLEILKNNEAAKCLLELADSCEAVLILFQGFNSEIKVYCKTNKITTTEIPVIIKDYILNIINNSIKWSGEINKDGEHIIDLCTPSPGPHFFVNLLMGNRIGYNHALQTTPKSVVDRFGGGSFRSHASTQVLATRWDLRQEENGFPANRQFYLLENYNKIFYSADPYDPNIESATCIHSQNHTVITYKTKCGLMIKRTIFILPQSDGEPIATEVQQIEIKNLGNKKRQLKFIVTGMFGSAAPHAIFEDVLYSNIILQSRILRNEDGTIAAIVPDYYPEQGKTDIRFSSVIFNKGEKSSYYSSEFSSNYNEFVGNGTLTDPHGMYKLSSNLYSKGPAFFALAGDISLEKEETVNVNCFTGIVSEKTNNSFNSETFKQEIKNLLERYSDNDEVEKAFKMNTEFYNKYTNSIQVKSLNNKFDVYFNRNLPFQVLYQTFVSRSFCQTQKGYREIGFREIQDIYASMYYFAGMGRLDFVKDLLIEWCEKIFEFGFAYHNFFWEGKEPGKWSDDALWFIQAVYRYISLSKDIGFLDEEYKIAGRNDNKKRSLYETIKAVLTYSGKISVGKHGLPLLDNADWNDCLKLDNDFIDGITKERKYREQLSEGGVFGEPFKSNYSESVMNAFLLKLAIDETISLAYEKKDVKYGEELKELASRLSRNIQEHAWKDDFFARVLFNRYDKVEFSYLGAKGDKLSSDKNIDGSYFLNSFNWSVLSDSATDEQIEKMLEVIEKYLKTPYGLKLVTPTDLGKVANDTATGHYFPGDRENGAVFKHASMMGVSALLKASKEVKDIKLAERLCELAYWMIDLVLPYNTMNNPFVKCGNPRFCTQYNNSQTGENIGPMLSGTSTWLTLSLMQSYGIEYTLNGIKLDPILRNNQESLNVRINSGKAEFDIRISKPKGFHRIQDGNYEIRVDGSAIKGNILPDFRDNKCHLVEVLFR